MPLWRRDDGSSGSLHVALTATTHERCIKSQARAAGLASMRRCLRHADRVVSNTAPGQPPDILRCFVFNISNLVEVRAGAKPVSQELGPYVYRKWRSKEV